VSGFGAGSDLALQITLWSARAAFVTSFVLIASIFVLRARLNSRARRRADLIAVWWPIFADAALGAHTHETPARLAALDLEPFLVEWNTFQDSFTSQARQGLNALIGRMGLTNHIRAMLRGKRSHGRALATVALGHLRDAESWPDLVKQIDSTHHVLSLLSAWALMEIDPERALPGILARATERIDWPEGRLAALLRQAGPDLVTAPLCTEILRGPAERTVVLLPFLHVAHQDAAAAVIRKLLETSPDERVICECLRAIADPSLLPLVRRYLTHWQWFVRLLAVEALGHIGEAQDVVTIIALLGDEQWWVRYRAAQALAGLPWLDTSALRKIHARQSDRFARDILEQAIAELRYQ
jgi:hypothetical protein